MGIAIGGQKNEEDLHGMLFDFNTLSGGLRSVGFSSIDRYNWKDFEPFSNEGYDDFSAAYLPHLDFENGRALVSGSNTGLSLTGQFSVKDFNVYMTNDTEEDLVVENKYTVNSRLPSGPYTYIDPYDDVVPAIFISSSDAQNKPFALGGMQDTVVAMKAVILADDTYQLDGVLSIFMDSIDECLNPIPMTGYPTTELGDLKDGSYNYTTVKGGYSGDMKFYINDVKTSKLTDRDRKSLAHDMYVGFIDFDVQQHRYRFN